MCVGGVTCIFFIFCFYLQAVIVLILLFSTDENFVFLNKPSLQCRQDFTCKSSIKNSFLCVFINVKLTDKYVKLLKDNELSFREFVRHSKAVGMKLVKLS